MDPKEIIRQLEGAAAMCDGAALCVAFREGTAVILSREPDALGKLLRVIEAGGKPMAILTHRKMGRQLEVLVNPLETVENEPGVEDYLVTIAEWYRSRLAEEGLVKPALVN